MQLGALLCGAKEVAGLWLMLDFQLVTGYSLPQNGVAPVSELLRDALMLCLTGCVSVALVVGLAGHCYHMVVFPAEFGLHATSCPC